MRVSIEVVVDLDQSALLTDNPPQDIRQSIADEVRSHLDSDSVRGALGIVDVVNVHVETVRA